MFINTGHGLTINLDHVTIIEDCGSGSRGQRRYRAHLTTGESVPIADYAIDPLEVMTAPVIPARIGDVLIVVTYCGTDDGGPEVVVEKMPVVAWRVAGTVAEPVTVDELAGNQRSGILMADGSVCEPYACSFPTVAAFVENATAALRRDEHDRA